MRPLPCLPPYHAKVVLIRLNNCNPGNTAEEKRASKERFAGGLVLFRTICSTVSSTSIIGWWSPWFCLIASWWLLLLNSSFLGSITICKPSGIEEKDRANWSSTVQPGTSYCAASRRVVLLNCTAEH